MIQPILCYSAEIWGYKVSDDIERYHVDYCKTVCCLNQHVNNFFALSECGHTPISVLTMSRCIKYWANLTQMPHQRYPKMCYMMS